MAQKYLKDLLPLTVITGSPHSPYNPLLQHLSSPVLTVNIAPRRFRGDVQVDVFERCDKLVQCVDKATKPNTTLVINNISLWVLYVGLEAVYTDLITLSKRYKVVGVLIETCHSVRVLETLYILANTVIVLDNGVVKSSIRRETGKMSLHTEQYTVSKGKMLISKIRVREEEEEKKVVDVTFNMGIKASEETARANTTLPYTHHTQQQEHAKQSAIHYVPDEVDDWDDEDPDEDLDI